MKKRPICKLCKNNDTVITIQQLERKLLNAIYTNMEKSPKWATLALRVLEKLHPKYKNQ